MGLRSYATLPCHLSPTEGKREMSPFRDSVSPAIGLPLPSSMSIQGSCVSDPSTQAAVSPQPTDWCLLHLNDTAKVECLLHPL